MFQLGVANEYLPRVLNTIITEKIVMVKSTQPKLKLNMIGIIQAGGPLSLALLLRDSSLIEFKLSILIFL